MQCFSVCLIVYICLSIMCECMCVVQKAAKMLLWDLYRKLNVPMLSNVYLSTYVLIN